MNEGAGTGRGKWVSTAHLPARVDALLEREVFTISADVDVAEAIRQFLSHRVKRLFVVDAPGRLVGILDRRALLKHILDGASGESDRSQATV